MGPRGKMRCGEDLVHDGETLSLMHGIAMFKVRCDALGNKWRAGAAVLGSFRDAARNHFSIPCWYH